MSEQAAQADGQQAASGAAATTTTTAAEWKPPSREEWEKVTKSLTDANKEAAANRKAKQEAEQKAAAEAEAKAKAEGDWKTLYEKTQAEKDALAKAAAEAETYKATVAAEVDALKAQLGDKAKAVEHLSPAQALPILKQFAALAAGPGAARPTTAGAPATHRPAPDVSAMTVEQYRALPEEEKKRVRQQLASTGAKASNGF